MKKLITTAKTTEVDFVSDQVVLLYNQHPALAEDQFLKTIIDEITGYSVKITDSINRERLYSNMKAEDKQVEKDARALKTSVKGYASMPDEKLSVPAKEILKVIERYKFEMFNLTHAQQASKVEAFLMDLSAESVKANAALLPTVPESIAAVVASQKRFMDKKTDYQMKYAETKEMQTASELKEILLPLINTKLNTYLSSAVMMTPEKYKPYVVAVENMIEEVNMNIRSRGKDNKDNNEDKPQ